MRRGCGGAGCYCYNIKYPAKTDWLTFYDSKRSIDILQVFFSRKQV